LAMDLTFKGGVITGSTEIDLAGIFEGVSLKLKPEVVSSFFDAKSEVTGVLVHVSSSLYLLLISEEKGEGVLSLFVLNGEKMKSGAERGGLFSTFWSRKDLYGRIAPFVEAVMVRGHYDEKWVLYKNGRKVVQGYLDARKRGLKSSEAMTESLESASA